MGPLDVEIATYERLREYLEANHKEEWVVIHGAELIGTYTDFQVAADTAVQRFGLEPFLLRRVAWPPPLKSLGVWTRRAYDAAAEQDKLAQETAAYARMREQLEANHKGEWAVISGAELAGIYPDYPVAVNEAVRRFEPGPYLIQEIGALPAKRYILERKVENPPNPPKAAAGGKLEREIATYERLREQLEANHKGEWAVIHGEEFVGTYPDFQIAADAATRRFGRGPYLIREIGAPPIIIPSYIVERQGYAHR